MTSSTPFADGPRWLLPFSLALAGYALLALCMRAPGRLGPGVWWMAQAVGWISCAWFLRTVSKEWPATRWIVATALAFRICGLCSVPTLEDDYQRYLWDGWRTFQDGSPYDHAPAEFFALAEKRPPGIETALNEVNHPDLTTIYAPITQLLFAAAAAVAPGSLFVLKLLLLAVDLAVMLLLAVIGGRGAAWFYGWCPLVVTEIGFHAHPEAWAVLWLLGAWLCARRQRYLCAGALAGVAVGAKLFALLVVPFLAWRRPAVVLPAFLTVLGFIYLPIFAAGSAAEWPAVLAMAASFEFNSLGYAVLAALCGAAVAGSLWLVVFGLVAAALFLRWAWQKRCLEEAPAGSLLLGFFLLSPVLNPWYLVWLAAFLALSPSRGGTALLIVVPLSYATGMNLGDPNLASYALAPWVRPVELAIFLGAALSSFWWPGTAGAKDRLS